MPLGSSSVAAAISTRHFDHALSVTLRLRDRIKTASELVLEGLAAATGQKNWGTLKPISKLLWLTVFRERKTKVEHFGHFKDEASLNL